MRNFLAQLLFAAFVMVVLTLVLSNTDMFEVAMGGIDSFLGADSTAPTETESDKTDAEVPKVDVSGRYQVAVTVNTGKTYTSDVDVTELSDNRLEVQSEYKGIPLVFIGKTAGAQGSARTWSFTPRMPGLFSGQATVTLTFQGEAIALTGSGSGSYTFFGKAGSGSGQGVGRRVALGSAQPKSAIVNALDKQAKFATPKKGAAMPSPVSAAAAGLAALIGGLASSLISSTRRFKKPKRSPGSPVTAPDSSSAAANISAEPDRMTRRDRKQGGR